MAIRIHSQKIFMSSKSSHISWLLSVCFAISMIIYFTVRGFFFLAWISLNYIKIRNYGDENFLLIINILASFFSSHIPSYCRQKSQIPFLRNSHVHTQSDNIKICEKKNHQLINVNTLFFSFSHLDQKIRWKYFFLLCLFNCHLTYTQRHLVLSHTFCCANRMQIYHV